MPARANLVRPGSDSLAIGLSAACLIHCMGLPVLIALMPALSTILSLPESVHLIALLLAVPASGLALLAGYRHHGVVIPAVFAAVGLLLLGAGALGGSPHLIETGLTVAGSVVLAWGHLHNMRLRRRERPPGSATI